MCKRGNLNLCSCGKVLFKDFGITTLLRYQLTYQIEAASVRYNSVNTRKGITGIIGQFQSKVYRRTVCCLQSQRLGNNIRIHTIF